MNSEVTRKEYRGYVLDPNEADRKPCHWSEPEGSQFTPWGTSERPISVTPFGHDNNKLYIVCEMEIESEGETTQ